MGTPYYPDITNPTPRGSTRKAILGTSNTTPISVNVAAHGYGTGDQVEIEGAVDANANGFWTITFVDAAHFTLNSSTTGGGGGAGGIVENWTLLPNGTIPSDGDLVDASNANPPLENVANMAGAYGYLTSGRYRIHDIYQKFHNDDTFGNWSATTVPNTSTWTALQNNPIFGFTTPKPNSLGTDAFYITGQIGSCQNAAANVVNLGLGVKFGGGAFTYIGGSGVQVGANTQTPLIWAFYLIGPQVLGGEFDFGWMGFAAANSPVSLFGTYTMQVIHLRPQ